MTGYLYLLQSDMRSCFLGHLFVAFAAAALLAFASTTAAAPQIILYYGQPVGPTAVRFYLADESPGELMLRYQPTVDVVVDGNAINIYATGFYWPDTAAEPFTIFTGTPTVLSSGDYTVNYYTNIYPNNQDSPGFVLKLSSPLTVLNYSDIQHTYEYYNAARDHYFYTADPKEIALLDSGQLAGWVRTGLQFASFVLSQTVPSTIVPVCRFYGLPQAGLDSHFFTADENECAIVQQRWPNAWQLESPSVFYVVPPITSGRALQAGCQTPVWRLFNNRSDAGHRYVAWDPVLSSIELSPAFDRNLAAGWTLEGVVWCTQ
jgi:hypothetical protein